MSPDETSKICKSLLIKWKKPLGIHAHDNKGLAFINTLTAIENGCLWCDATILGMGRGAGNTKTENLLLELQSMNLHKGNYNYLIKTVNNFTKLKKELKWGTNSNYHFAANNNIHPTYIQTLEKDPRYSQQQIDSILKILCKKKTSSFNKNHLREFIYDKPSKLVNGSWDATGWLKDKEVIIIGAGPSIEKYKDSIINYIKDKQLPTFFLNINNIIPNEIGYATIISHETRMLFDFQKLCKLEHFIITPYSRFKANEKLKLINKKILDYGLSVQEDTYQIFPKGCRINSSLAIAYALAVVTQAQAKNF